MNDNEMSSAEITAELAAEANPLPMSGVIMGVPCRVKKLESLTKELTDAKALLSEMEELSAREYAEFPEGLPLAPSEKGRLEELREDIRPREMIMNLEVEMDQVKGELPSGSTAPDVPSTPDTRAHTVNSFGERLTDADTQEQIDETKDDLLEELKEWLIASHECEIKEVLPLTEDVVAGVLKFASEYEGNHFMGYEVSRY